MATSVTKTLAVVLLLALASLVPSRLLAQWSERPELVSLPSVERQWGVRAGTFRIWPRLSVEGRFDSNLYRRDEGEDPVGVGILRLQPGISLVNPDAPVVRVRLDVDGDFRFYFADSDAANGQKEYGGTSALDVQILPRGPLTIRLFDQFRRALETRNYSTPQEIYNRTFNLAGAQVLFRPGGGALEFGVEYAFAFDFFDEFTAGDQRYHDFGFHTLWKFYPLTAAFVDVDFKLISYDEKFLKPELGLTNIGSMPLRAVIGLNGQITTTLAVLVEAGWAEGLYDEGPSFSGPVGLARASWRVTPTTLLQLGYARDYEDSLYGNYYGEHRIFFSGEQRLFGWLGIKANAAFHFIDYAKFEPESPDYTVNEPERADQALELGVALRFDVARWVGFNLGYRFDALYSDVEVRLRGQVVDVYSYYRHQVFASVVGRY